LKEARASFRQIIEAPAPILLKALPGTVGIVFIRQRLGRFNLAVSPVSWALVFK
jgi:hypothetical protein